MRGRGRILILVGLILLLGVIAVVILINSGTLSLGGGDGGIVQRPTEALPTATPIRFVNIVVALQELPRGIRIPEDEETASTAVALRPWPEELVPFNALTELDDVLGKIARIDIPREAPILSTMVVDSLQDIAAEGSDAAAVMPPGLVAVSVPMDRLTGVAYGVRDGDYVDVILSMLYVDVDEEFQSILPNRITLVGITEDGNIEVREAIEGRLDVGIGGSPVVVGPAEIQRPRLLTQRTVQSAWVVHVGTFPLNRSFLVEPTPTPIPTQVDERVEQGRPTSVPSPTPAPPDIITLAVTPQDAVVLVWAIEARIPITLALRSATDISQVPTQPVTLNYIMSTYNITTPPDRLPYALEPALRSIRQLVIFQEIRLQDGSSSAGGGG